MTASQLSSGHARGKTHHPPIIAPTRHQYIDMTTSGRYTTPMMTPNPMISLYDLSEKTGVEARTLRSWIAADLLIAPIKGGRGALYPESNINRAHAVLALKGMYSMSEISRMFLTASEDQIQDWAAGRIPDNGPRSSTLDYLGAVKARTSPPKGKVPPEDARVPDFLTRTNASHSMKPTDPASGDLTALERLLVQLDHLVNGSFSKRVRGETWTRIGVTRDLELSVRGSLRPDELRQFEVLAGQLRTILTGRITHE